MTVRFGRIAAVVAAACLASACNKVPGNSASTNDASAAGGSEPAAEATGGPAYQLAALPGSASVAGGFIRVNVATGQAVINFSDSAVYTPILDSPVPAGHYQVYLWAQIPATNGDITWDALRMDTVSGRVWHLNGSSAAGFSWGEVTGAQPPAATPAQ